MTPKIVIIGGGFGGLEAARNLRTANAVITLIDRNNHHLFQPLLYQVATAGLSPADIAYPIRSVLKKQKNIRVVMGEVKSIDRTNKSVTVETPVSSVNFIYDYLIIASGSKYNYFKHPEWEKFAPCLKSIEDATIIRRKILMAFEAAELERDPDKKCAYLTFLCIGGGPTGVELAGSIAELAHRALAQDFNHIKPEEAKIILLEAGPSILGLFSNPLPREAVNALKKLGVDIRCNSSVDEINENGVIVHGEFIPSKTVLWAAGVLGSDAGTWLNTEVDKSNRVIVNKDLSLEGDPKIFIIGDTAMIRDLPLPGVAPVAMQQGRYAAKLITDELRGNLNREDFHYHDKGNLATVGRSFAIMEFGKIKLHGFIAWIAWLVVHIIYLIGFRNRILVLLQWAWAYFTYQRGARLIIIPKHQALKEVDMPKKKDKTSTQ